MNASALPMINVFGANVGQEEIDALTPSMRAGWMGMGKQVRAFESRLSQRVGCGVVMVDSGSNALHLAVKVLDLPAGSDVLVPSLTWVACAQAVILAGHRPVFADVDLLTYNVTAETLARARTPHTRAVMVVHYAGKPVDLEPIRALGLPIIEDAAHAVDSTVAGRYCGGLGTVGIYSFDSVKNLATPDGGAVLSHDPAIVARLQHLRYCGIGKSGFDSAAGSADRNRWWEYQIHEVFPRILPNDISASIGLVQLEKLADNQQRRKAIWERYQRELAGLDWLATPQEAGEGERHSYFTYLVRILNGRRDALASYLLEQRIYTTFRYHPLHLNPIYRSEASLANCELLNEQGLNLPLHPALSDGDVERILSAIRRFHG
jgi:aminotransferase